MNTQKNLYKRLYSWSNINDAYLKARKRKGNTLAVKEFEKHHELHICTLIRELREKTYRPKPLKTFILRDPKTRRICVSEFRDRVVHHALINILEPIFEPRFIHDSYASRKGKGTVKALDKLRCYMRRVSGNGMLTINPTGNNDIRGYALKADIQHYFETVDHAVLIDIIESKVKDKEIVELIRRILGNYESKDRGKGMPLGNWTSQFLANVYLNELDQFVKNTLKAKYYIRYVDDFVILHRSRITLRRYKVQIKEFLDSIKLELHPTKCSIKPLGKGIEFLGFRNFLLYQIPRKRNVRKMNARLDEMVEGYGAGNVEASQVFDSLHGWNGYAMQGDTYKLRQALQRCVEHELEKRTPIRHVQPA